MQTLKLFREILHVFHTIDSLSKRISIKDAYSQKRCLRIKISDFYLLFPVFINFFVALFSIVLIINVMKNRKCSSKIVVERQVVSNYKANRYNDI